MNKNFYFSGILLFGLAAAAQLFSNLLYFRIGALWNALPSAAPMYLPLLILSLIASLFLLRYYYAKKYWFVFSTFAADMAAGLCLGILTYLVVLNKEPNRYTFPLSLFALATGMAHAISLFTSRARKNIWLSTAGIWLLVGLAVRAMGFIWTMDTHGVHAHLLAERLIIWSSVGLGITPVFFILQFSKEARQAAEVVGEKSSVVFLGTVGVLAFAWTIFLGISLDRESRGLPSADNPISDMAAMEARPFEAHTYMDSQGDSLPYRLLKPLDYTPGKQYPLVVCLHHGGAHGKDNIRQVEAAEPAWTLCQEYNMRKHPAFIFVPQSPPGFCWGGIPNYPSIDSLVFEAIRYLEGQYSIDVHRVYVAGISMGGYGSWHFICSRPKMFAAAIPISGAGDTAVAGNAVGIPVWAFHGALDKSVPVEKERAMIEAMKKAGGHPQYTEFADGNHNVWDQVNIRSPELLDWLFAQKRN
ncbi:MAG TPA: dienelactone hydrolase family protein [Puia sp.]|nr:dienelactone hydrolase family protein [Puia sp.]